jgi:hypothetical protein
MIFEYKARKLSINYEPLKIRYKLLVAYIYIYIYIYMYICILYIKTSFVYFINFFQLYQVHKKKKRERFLKSIFSCFNNTKTS